MKRIICKDYNEVSRLGAFMFAQQIWSKPDSVLGFATGGTPVGMYRYLVDMYKDGMVDFSAVTTFNLDEYYPMSKSHKQSYDYFMWDNLFSHINVKRENVFLPNGGAADAQKACDEYEHKLTLHGGVDLQLLGIGNNGHIAFNEPCDELHVKTHVIELTEDTIEANARFFDSRDDVPRKALTMGLGSIMKARRIVMLITGKAKTPVVKQMFSGMITPQIPASLLQLHPDVTVVLDTEAAGEL
ncbi:MAG: glucosamine-6-phosphate deaminase [Oscillospiraceae bacterium]|nr:glucosamine-6-phosphate deaminase [Oscillospiraceae bacterium]